MTLADLKNLLAAHPEKNIQIVLPTGTKIPPHAHITDVARIDKQFIDCGGTVRTESMCRLQTWFADDTEHRVGARILLKVLEKAAPFLRSDDLEVDIEYEAPFISQFPIESATIEGDNLLIRTGIRHTTCLAPERCLPPKVTINQFKPLPKLEVAKCC